MPRARLARRYGAWVMVEGEVRGKEYFAGVLERLTLPLIRLALEQGVPVLAICRGIQEVNVALGGTLHQHVQEVEGLADHRAPKGSREEMYALAHEITLEPGGQLAQLAGLH